METIYYIVKSIDGDYANLVKEDDLDGETKLVARALLPDSIREGCRLKYQFLQYEMCQWIEKYVDINHKHMNKC